MLIEKKSTPRGAPGSSSSASHSVVAAEVMWVVLVGAFTRRKSSHMLVAISLGGSFVSVTQSSSPKRMQQLTSFMTSLGMQ